MPVIQVHDKKFQPYLTAEQIDVEIGLHLEISRDYKGKRPLFIAILNGSFMFAADLFKHMGIEAEISFIKLASYKGYP